MYSPPKSGGTIELHWSFDHQRLHAQLRSSQTQPALRWLAVAFPVNPNAALLKMVGSTAVIGSDLDGVQVYTLSGTVRELVSPLANVWQTLEDASFDVNGDGTVLTFSKKLDEDLPEQPSDQQPILPNDERTDILIAAGTGGGDNNDELNYHGQYRYNVSLWLGWAHYTPP